MASSLPTIIPVEIQPPSRTDDLLTERVRECSKLLGVRFLDHVIIGKPTETTNKNYYS